MPSARAAAVPRACREEAPCNNYKSRKTIKTLAAAQLKQLQKPQNERAQYSTSTVVQRLKQPCKVRQLQYFLSITDASAATVATVTKGTTVTRSLSVCKG